MSADDNDKSPKSLKGSATLPLFRVNESASSSGTRTRAAVSSSSMPLHAQGVASTSSNDIPTPPDGNVLRIKAGSFGIDLEGDSEFIHASYTLMRHHILARLRDTLEQNTTRDEPKVSQIQRNHKHGGFIWVYVCHPLYNKIHVVSRDALRNLPIGTVINPEPLNKIYVQRRGLSKLDALVGASKTLWSELTTEGRKRLKRAKT